MRISTRNNSFSTNVDSAHPAGAGEAVLVILIILFVILHILPLQA